MGLFVVVVLMTILSMVLPKRIMLPVIIVGFIAWAVMTWRTPAHRAHDSGAALDSTAGDVPQAADLPADQAAFCLAIGHADTAYEHARSVWKSETNLAIRDEMTVSLNALRQSRDKEVFAIIGHGVTGWMVKLTSAAITDGDPAGTGVKRALLSGNLLCRNTVTLSAGLVLTPRLSASRFDVGDTVSVSGHFLPRDGGGQTPQQALDWDGSEGQAMAAPSYRMDVDDIRGRPPA